jgi:hypothetical protein
MPEGDAIFRAATVLRRVLLGQCLTGFETTARQVAVVNARRPGTATPRERVRSRWATLTRRAHFAGTGEAGLDANRPRIRLRAVGILVALTE